MKIWSRKMISEIIFFIHFYRKKITIIYRWKIKYDDKTIFFIAFNYTEKFSNEIIFIKFFRRIKM